jgi:hypothetical protein
LERAVLFPELTERLLKLLRIKHFEPAHTIGLDRPLTVEEHKLTKWLLLHSGSDAARFLPQLEAVHVRGQCSCGCPTVNLEVPANVAPVNVHSRVLSDFVGSVNGNFVGVLLHQRGGYLCELEVYDLSDIPRPFGLPETSTLRPFEGEALTAAPD